jgi:hypothetical protein
LMMLHICSRNIYLYISQNFTEFLSLANDDLYKFSNTMVQFFLW